jgi:hypothetical protein
MGGRLSPVILNYGTPIYRYKIECQFQIEKHSYDQCFGFRLIESAYRPVGELLSGSRSGYRARSLMTEISEIK